MVCGRLRVESLDHIWVFGLVYGDSGTAFIFVCGALTLSSWLLLYLAFVQYSRWECVEVALLSPDCQPRCQGAIWENEKKALCDKYASINVTRLQCHASHVRRT